MTGHDIEVPLGSNAYRVHIERGGEAAIAAWASALTNGRRLYVISDETVSSLWATSLTAALNKARLQATLLTAGIDEKRKTLESTAKIFRDLLAQNVDRDSCVMAVGGGVVGDVAGFVAAVSLRGLPWLQVPTTLLAQVDASVGGKVGVNFDGIKNVIGAFHQPLGVFIDPDFLSTLPGRELTSGFAEVVKHALIADAVLAQRLEREAAPWSLQNKAFIDEILRRSIAVKARIVGQDEREAGVRAYLNFGHTLGHAVELSGLDLLHGEAVAIGMAFAVELSTRMKLCSTADAQRAQQLIGKLAVATSVKQLEFDAIWQRLWHDKKRRGEKIRMVLLRRIGEACVAEVEKKELEKLFNEREAWWGEKQ